MKGGVILSVTDRSHDPRDSGALDADVDGGGPASRGQESTFPITGPELFAKTHRILERRFMEFQPFGKDPAGETIRDMSGVSIRSNVEYLEETIARAHGPEAGRRAVQELVDRLNERIADGAYHVTSAFLKNPWMSYSNEFTAYLVEFCIDLSGEADFQFNMGREKLIPALIQTLMRPFSVGQIYKMAAYWARQYCQNSYCLEGLEVTDRSAVLRMTLTDRALRQFGPYRRACARIWCNALKVGISIVPDKVHHLGPATVRDRKCVVEGDECCEWDVQWASLERWYPGKRIATAVARRLLRKEINEREAVIKEQMQSLETRHEELHKAYLELQETAVELQRRVDHLTTLHQAGLAFTSTRDREALIQRGLETLIHKLHYDRVLIDFYDPLRGVVHGARLFRVSPDIEAFAGELKIPVTDPMTIEGTVHLRGQPVLVNDISEVRGRIHPLHWELAARMGTESIMAVPLKVKDRILGALTVERVKKHMWTPDDLDLLVTFGNALAIALDNVEAYQKIEELNARLELKVRDRTAQLEAANEQLKELDRLKNQFLSHVSHDLRTPLTAINGFTINLIDGVYGPLTPKQAAQLERVKANVERLTRMIAGLLDLSRIVAGKLLLVRTNVALAQLARDVIEEFQLMAMKKGLHLDLLLPSEDVSVSADADRVTQILTNLIENAAKFTPSGGSITVRVERAGDEHAAVTVSDTGPGIPPESISRLFDPFFQAHPGAATGKAGIGLGLAIVKYLVDLHGGAVSVTSTLGKGASFQITLPLTKPESHDAR